MFRHWALFLAVWTAIAVAHAQEAVPTGPTLNPDISVIIDGYYHYDDADEPLSDILHGIDGFGHTHGGGHGHGHRHAELENGFNLRHLELMFSAQVDPYFYAEAIAAVDREGAELEAAFVQTTALPHGLQLKFGKFFSDFGRVNPMHPHQYDFLHQPLAHRLLFGKHGLNDVGLQASWLAPMDSYVLIGAEAFQGNDQTPWPYLGEEESEGVLDDIDGPRIGVLWLKYGPDLGGTHGLELGLAGGLGVRQEAHDGNADGTIDHWLEGDAYFLNAHAVYKYDNPQAYGEGDVVAQFEYFYREVDVEVKRHDLMPAFVGNRRVDTQDGLYLQAVYGFAPRWRAGGRYEIVGLINESDLPSGATDTFDASNRVSLMTDYSPTEFSRLRLTVARGEYEVDDASQEVWEGNLQLIISIGEHGAHRF